MDDQTSQFKQRLKELAQLQKDRHLTAEELWEAAELLRKLGNESGALEAESAAMRQQARETLNSPDATFSLDDESAIV